MNPRRCLGIGLACASLAATLPAREMSIQVRTGQLRERPSFLGPIVAELDYGERVDVNQVQGDWNRVTFGDRAGWIHRSALTRARIRLTPGESEAATGASSDEMALAGKGFNAEVEAEFKNQNQSINFTWVDRMETFGFAPERLTEFMTQGGVKPVEGGP